MKLRLRSYESKETLKIEAPNPCNLNQLKAILSQSLPNSPSPASIRLSLNRKDELQSDGQESLHSLGIAGGDLIYYSLPHTVNVNTPPPEPVPDFMDIEIETPNSSSRVLVLQTEIEKEAENDVTESSYESDVTVTVTVKSFSVPGFLRKVFVEELGDDAGRDHKLVVTAVHAVFLESRFVGFDPDTNAVTNGFRVRDAWPCRVFALSLFYTLPEIASGVGDHTVVLKFQSLGKFLNVYGSLGGGGLGKGGTRFVRLNEDQLVPFLNVVWVDCCDKDGDFSDTSSEKEVFKFWRTVKDNLALPLLIDICDKAGLALPPCFMRLPTDLKLKILELVPGVELAKVSCLCSELRYLASNDDLWKLKFTEEYGNGTDKVQGSWKNAFVRTWERQNSRKHASRVRPAAPYWPAQRGIRYGRPPFVPHIIGGEHDLWPHLGNDMHNRLHGPANRLRRNFSPQCNFGGRDFV